MVICTPELSASFHLAPWAQAALGSSAVTFHQSIKDFSIGTGAGGVSGNTFSSCFLSSFMEKTLFFALQRWKWMQMKKQWSTHRHCIFELAYQFGRKSLNVHLKNYLVHSFTPLKEEACLTWLKSQKPAAVRQTGCFLNAHLLQWQVKLHSCCHLIFIVAPKSIRFPNR